MSKWFETIYASNREIEPRFTRKNSFASQFFRFLHQLLFSRRTFFTSTIFKLDSSSKKAQDLKAQIDATDKAIDTMVYELYGLSDEEISIVENS